MFSDSADPCTCSSAAERVVTAECKVCSKDQNTLTPAAREMAEEMYKNVTMGIDSYVHTLAHVEDNRLKTDMTAAMCYYEKLAGKIKQFLLDAGVEPAEGGMMAKMSARAGIAMNTIMDKTNSHIAEMLIEGCTMSITTATKLRNHAKGKEACAALVEMCDDWAKFEENHVERLKAYL